MNQNHTIINNRSNRNLQKLLSFGSSAKQRSSVFTINEANKKIGFSINSRKSKISLVKPHFKELFCELTEKVIKEKYKSNSTQRLIIDCIICLIDLVVVGLLYFSHFTYNKNNYSLTSEVNTERLISLLLSLLVIIFLLYRYYLKRNVQYFKYLLCLRSSIPSERLKYESMLVEMIIHLIQPFHI